MPSKVVRKSRRVDLLGAAASIIALATSLLVGSVASAAPRPTTPAVHIDPAKVDPKLHRRISTVNAELARLGRQNDRLDERYNIAAAAVAADQTAAGKAQQVAARAEAAYQVAHRQFVQGLTAQYEGGSALSVGALMGTSDPQQYIDGLNLADLLSQQFASLVDADRAARARATSAQQQAAHALATARAERAVLATRRTALVEQQRKFRTLLDSLTAQQRREVAHARAVAEARARQALLAQSSGAPILPGSVPGALRKVISFAESQVGKSYVFGAAGPDVFDCSGLTMAAFAQVGIQLPHSALDQYGYGKHVTYDQLRPGDLIFLYSPIDHVELYVGNDLAVSAADPALGIIYTHPSSDLADYAGATRLIG